MSCGFCVWTVSLWDSNSHDGATAWKDFGLRVAFIEKLADRYREFSDLRPRTEKKVAEKHAGLNYSVYLPLVNKVQASGQAIREASLSVLRLTVQDSETSRTQKNATEV